MTSALVCTSCTRGVQENGAIRLFILCEGLAPPHNYTDMRTITVNTQLSTRAT